MEYVPGSCNEKDDEGEDGQDGALRRLKGREGNERERERENSLRVHANYSLYTHSLSLSDFLCRYKEERWKSLLFFNRNRRKKVDRNRSLANLGTGKEQFLVFPELFQPNFSVLHHNIQRTNETFLTLIDHQKLLYCNIKGFFPTAMN